jgi:hypothetical protein
MIHEEICTYEVCKLAKEKGFDGLCYAAYDREGVLLPNDIPNPNMSLLLTDCIAPTQSVLQRWLREGEGIVVEVIAYPTCSNNKKNCYWWSIKQNSDGICYQYEECSDTLYGFGFAFDTYELALEDALKYALENLV